PVVRKAVPRPARAWTRTSGAADGSIIAVIISAQAPRNGSAAICIPDATDTSAAQAATVARASADTARRSPGATWPPDACGACSFSTREASSLPHFRSTPVTVLRRYLVPRGRPCPGGSVPLPHFCFIRVTVLRRYLVPMSGYGAARGGSRTGGGRRGLRGAQAAAARGAASRRLEVECDEDSRRG